MRWKAASGMRPFYDPARRHTRRSVGLLRCGGWEYARKHGIPLQRVGVMPESGK